MRLDLAARERRLEHVRGVDRALGRAGPDERVQLVEEEDDVLRLPDLLHDRLEPLLELAAVLGAGHQRAQVELEQPLAARGRPARRGSTIFWASPSTIAVLPTPGLADEDRVVLGAAGQDLDDPLDLLLAADDRVELALAGELGQVARELVEHRGLASASSGRG